MGKKDIAIIGLAGRFHGSEDIKEFWENLAGSKELLQFFTKEELLELGVDKSIANNPKFVPVDSVIENAESFDFSFFGYTRDEANLMDPQIRIMHELVWTALEDAGCDPHSYLENIGLFLSASNNLRWVAHALTQKSDVNPFFISQIANKDFLSSLISYSLDLKGPSYLTSTACSSSLTSVHLACRSLLMRECSIAIAGGISINCKEDIGYFHKEGMIESVDGHCKPFDKDSTGTVGGNGGAVVVFKRLEDAIRDNDNIYGVVRSTAANNDGKRKVGYTAPSIKGQAECINLAHKIANVTPESISYIETHGTGTKLGDPIEISALNNVFNSTTHKCAIGSVKSNIGHLDAAAGIAGFIKTCLSLKNRKIPASLHFKESNPNISFKSGPFHVNNKLVDWNTNDDTPLRAGVSSFGIGGTNVHVVMEEFLSNKKTQNDNLRSTRLLPISGKTPYVLDKNKKDVEEFIKEIDQNQLSNLSYTLINGRRHFDYRNYLTCQNNQERLEVTSDYKTIVKKDINNVVFLFPGQGSQYFEMAKGLYEEEPFFRSMLDKGFEQLEGLTGTDFKLIIGFKKNQIPDETLIHKTLYTQPLVFLIEYSLASYLMYLGVQPTYMIGHSLGEYVAATIAGVFSFEKAIEIIVKRAELMNKVPQGTMVSVGISAEKIRSLIDKDISIAAINSSDSCVISGQDESISKCIKDLDEKDINYKILKTSHAFHSNMMDDILLEYQEFLKSFKFSEPVLDFISNLTGQPIKSEEATSVKYWVKHLRETVNFSKGLEYLNKKENNIFIEIGSGKTLIPYAKQKKNIRGQETLNLLKSPKEDVNDTFYFTNVIGKLWSYGLNLDWDKYFENENVNKISAPTYNFDHTSLDYKVDPYSGIGALFGQEASSYDNWFYTKNWKKSSVKQITENINKGFIVFSNDKKFNLSIKSELENQGETCIDVLQGDSFKKVGNSSYQIKDDLKKLFIAIKEQEICLNNIILKFSFVDDLSKLQDYFIYFLNVCREIIAYYPDQQKKITLISDYNNEVLGGEKINVSASTISTLFKILAQENPIVSFSQLDINESDRSEDLLQSVIKDIKYNFKDQNIAYRNKYRWVEFYDSIELPKNNTITITNEKTYLITGGLGHLGYTIASYLGANYNATIILTGRSELPIEDTWEAYLSNEDSKSSLVNKIKRFKKLKEQGLKVHYYRMDVSSLQEMQSVVSSIENNLGKISGIVHAAGVIDNHSFKPVGDIDIQNIETHFNPKIHGTLNLYNAFKNSNLDFVWISSSLSSILGGLTYGSYAAANKFIDAFIENNREELQNWRVVNLDGLGQGAIQDHELINIFEDTLSLENCHQSIISLNDPNKFEFKKEIIPEKEEKKIFLEKENYDPPSTETEKVLCELWQSFFGYESISITDSFFDLGGDSLKAMTLVKRIQGRFELEINLLDFFGKPTIKELAKDIDVAKNIFKLNKQSVKKNKITI